MTYRLGIDVGERVSDWVALGQERGVDSPLASGTVDSVAALIDGVVLAGSQVASADRSSVHHVATGFARRLGDAEPIMVGGTPYGAESLVGHLVASIVSDARSKLGSDPGAVVLVHDDDLDDYRRSLWAEAGRLAGIPLAQLTLLSRTEALAQSVAAGVGGLNAAAGAAKVGWARHPGLPGPESTSALGAAAAGAGVAAAGGGILAATVLGGGEAIAAAPAGVAGLGPVGSPLAGPAGSPLSPPAGPAGPAGSPLSPPAGPTGTPLSPPAGPSGPAGSPLSAPPGPTGTPLGTVARKGAVEVAKRSYRIPILAGSIVGAGLIAGVAVLAAGGDDPVSAPSTTVVVDVSDGVSNTGATSATTQDTTESGVVEPTAPASTAPAVSAPSACTLGSWVMDNDSFAAIWAATAAGEGVAATLASVTGTVTVEVDENGLWTSTYSDWGFSIGAEGVVVSLSITGSDTSSGSFADDGSFTFTEAATNTVVTMTAIVDGVSVPVPPQADTRSVFMGVGTYVCEGDTMTVTTADNPGPIVMNRAA